MGLEKDIILEFKRRVFEESYIRIFNCLNLLNEEQMWFSQNENSNSIANLILHLEGNMRQWMCSTFNKKEDSRKRSEEFDQFSIFTKKQLESKLLQLKEEILTFIDDIKMEDLEKKYKVQVYNEKGISIIIHVIEHFSYHTGQIAILTKILSDKDLEFYPYSLE